MHPKIDTRMELSERILNVFTNIAETVGTNDLCLTSLDIALKTGATRKDVNACLNGKLSLLGNVRRLRGIPVYWTLTESYLESLKMRNDTQEADSSESEENEDIVKDEMGCSKMVILIDLDDDNSFCLDNSYVSVPFMVPKTRLLFFTNREATFKDQCKKMECALVKKDRDYGWVEPLFFRGVTAEQMIMWKCSEIIQIAKRKKMANGEKEKIHFVIVTHSPDDLQRSMPLFSSEGHVVSYAKNWEQLKEIIE